MTPDEVITAVSNKRGIPTSAILGPTRGKRSVVDARDEIIRILRTYGLSTPKIGKAVNRDHTTVIAALRRTEPVPVFRSSRNVIKQVCEPEAKTDHLTKSVALSKNPMLALAQMEGHKKGVPKSKKP